jgi:hypothetical protein
VATHFVDREPLKVLEIAEMRPGARILELAGRQHGVVTSAQLGAAGWSPTVIRGRVRTGWLRRLHHGVYLVGPLDTPHTTAMAAVLATDGIVSSYPAAVLWDWRPPREGPMHVIAAGRGQAGLIVHHTALDPRDITRRHGTSSGATTTSSSRSTAGPSTQCAVRSNKTGAGTNA